MAERTTEEHQAGTAADGSTAPAGDAVGAPAKATGAKVKAGSKSAATKRSTPAKKAAKSSAKKAAKAGGAAPPDPPKQTRSPEEVERIREALTARLTELREEYQVHVAEITELQRERLTDSAGDDQADTGSKTFEREQEISLAHSILERTTQVERALERLEEGHYGWCERCGNAIPVERLAAFPSATLCIPCKQLEERR